MFGRVKATTMGATSGATAINRLVVSAQPLGIVTGFRQGDRTKQKETEVR